MQNRFMIMLALWAMAFPAVAAEVDLDTARQFARDWRGKGIRAARTHRNAAGESRFHVVNFEGGGWAAVGADDEESPVIAFSDNGDDLVEDERNAVWFLVKRDGERRAFARREVKRKGEERKCHKGWAAPYRRASSPTALSQQSTTTVKTAASTIALEDVRVAPLIQSTWDQSDGYKTYNYYTPNNYVCGCVATMLAQILRYYEWPTTSVVPFEGECMVGTNIYKLSSMSVTNCTAIGGMYDWVKMTLKPDNSTPTENRREIAKLCYDAGVSVNMMWSGTGSGALMADVRDALVEDWGYVDAHLVVYDYPTKDYPVPEHPYDFEELKRIVVSNCEAGRPIGYGISGDSGGHAVVIDGYGYSSSGDFYMHINPGWGGSANAWYNPPNLSMGGLSFNESDELVYNIISRRVPPQVIFR